MRTPEMIFTGAVLAAVVAAGLYFFGPREPNVVVSPDPVVVVPLEHPPATGGSGEPPPINQPQPVEPPDVVPIEPPTPSGGVGEPPSTNQPNPVVPPVVTEPTKPNIHPPKPGKPVWKPKPKPKPHVKKPKPKPPVVHKPKPKPHVKKPRYKKRGIDPKLWDMQRHYFYHLWK